MKTNQDEVHIRGALQAWGAAFNDCNVEKVVALYAPEALLWGTVSQALISSPGGIRDYFLRTFAAAPLPKVELGEPMVRLQGETAVSSGTYTFTLGVQGEPRTLPARFSFTYRKSGPGWLITSHHSSLIPLAAPSASAPSR
jgi:hypothetical protein